MTLRDVAERAAVSVSTASRILSNSTKETYPEATQVRVLRASMELGYRPNFAARALASGKSYIIAVIFPRIYDTPFTALSSLQILSSIEAFCSQHGYHILLSSPRVAGDEVDDSLTNLLAGGYPDGIIIDGHFRIDPIDRILAQFPLPTVMLGYQKHQHYLRADNFQGGCLLMEHIAGLGHQEIGIISIADGNNLGLDERTRGVYAAAEPHHHLRRVNGTLSVESGAAATEALLKAHPKLTAIIAMNDRMALGAIRQLHKMGYRVPDDISVVGFDNLPQSTEFTPTLTTIDQQFECWGTLAMNMLLGLFAGRVPQSTVLTPRLIVRQSSAAPR